MQARNRLNLLLALAVLLIGGLIWQTEKPVPAPEPERLTALTADTIQRIEIHPARAAPSVLERLDGQWRLTEPFAAVANASKIKTVQDFARAPSLARYAVSAVDLSQLGLAPADLTLRINDVTLAVGATEALQGWRYVRVGDTVHLIVDRYSYLLQAGPAAMVSSHLLPEGARLREIQLPGLHLQQGDAGWRQIGTDRLAGGAGQSADALQMLADEWRYAQALRVSRVGQTDLHGEAIRLRFYDADAALEFILQRDTDEVRLIHAAQGLIYHFTPAAAERLLALPETSHLPDDA